MCTARVADQEDDREDDDDGRGDENLPGDAAVTVLGIVTARRADVFGTREVQVGKFFDLGRRLRLESRLAVRGARCPYLYRACGTDLGLPRGLGVDLSLAETGEIGSDRLFAVEPEMLGVGADEALVEDAAGKLVEVLFLDGLQHARADLGDVGNVIQREILVLACRAEFVSELAHWKPVV